MNRSKSQREQAKRWAKSRDQAMNGFWKPDSLDGAVKKQPATPKQKRQLRSAMERLEVARGRLAKAKTETERQNAMQSVTAREKTIAAMHRKLGLTPGAGEEQKGSKGRKKAAAPKQSSSDFYRSDAWRAVRYQALLAHGRECLCCGAKPGNGVVLHVDHVKPRSLHPELELEISNLQILCADCNLGKSNVDDTDFRPRKQELVWDDELEQMKRDMETAYLRLEMLDDEPAVEKGQALVKRLRAKLEKAIREREYPH